MPIFDYPPQRCEVCGINGARIAPPPPPKKAKCHSGSWFAVRAFWCDFFSRYAQLSRGVTECRNSKKKQLQLEPRMWLECNAAQHDCSGPPRLRGAVPFGPGLVIFENDSSWPQGARGHGRGFFMVPVETGIPISFARFRDMCVFGRIGSEYWLLEKSIDLNLNFVY